MQHAMPLSYSRSGDLARPSQDTLKIVLCFFLFILLCTVAIQINYDPAAPNDGTGSIAKLALATQGSDSIRRVFHLLIFATVLVVAYAKGYTYSLRAVSIAYMLACGWCILSGIWAIDPFASIKRSIGMVVLLSATASIVSIIGARLTIKVMYYFFASTLIASYIAVALHSNAWFAFAVHPANESDQNLVGNWRGVFWHKNVAGPVMTHAAILFLHSALGRKRLVDWALCLAAMGFVVGTHSKTAVALAGLVIVSGLLYRRIVSERNGNQLFVGISAFVLLSLVVVGFAESDKLSAFFSDPQSLTGRMGVWMSLFNYVRGHAWFGSGYGSFYGIGYQSPIYSVAVTQWSLMVLQSHNGYLEVLVTTGIIGLVLALNALVVLPFIRFVTGQPSDARLYGMCFSMWMFGILQNFTEAQFFSPDKQSWIFVVIAISMVHCHSTMRSREASTMREAGSARRLAKMAVDRSESGGRRIPILNT